MLLHVDVERREAHISVPVAHRSEDTAGSYLLVILEKGCDPGSGLK